MAWLLGWGRRKKQTITGTTAGAQTNYQKKMVVHKGSGSDSSTDVYCGGNCRDDFGDIRWTKEDGTTLSDYWIESVVSGDNAVFWVEIPSIPTGAGTVDCYMYYDKSDETSLSDGNTTFDFFDDFETVTQSEWTGSVTVSASTDYVKHGTYSLKATTTSAGTFYKNTVTIPEGNYVTELWCLSHSGTYRATGPASHKTSSNYVTEFLYGYNNRLYTDVMTNDSLDRADYSYSHSADTWYKLKYILNNGSVSFYDPNNNLLRTTTYTPSALFPFYLGMRGDVGQVSYYDLYIVRKYASPEPTWGAWGGEETGVETYYATINSNARVKITQTPATINGNARIKVAQTQTVTGNARIVLRHYETIAANSRIKVPTPQTITGTARIKKTLSQTVGGNATVVFREYETVGANARIKATKTKTITGNADIKKTLTKTIAGNARIQIPATIISNARIKVPFLKTITGNARIKRTITKNVTGNATVVFRHHETITGKAYIESIQRYETQLSYRFDRETKARAIAGVANSIGYEWWVDEDDILCFYDQRGHDKSATITLGDEITAFDNSFDATKVIDKLTVVGVGPGSTHLEVTVGTGEMEGTFSAKDIHDIDTLTSFANATLDQTKQAKHRMTVELAGTERTDFELGDIVHITYSDAGIDGDYRIISMERVSGVAGESTKLEVAVPQFRVTETLMDAKRRLDADEYHPQGAPSILTLHESDNVDSTHPLKMKFYVPEEAVDMGKLQIKEAKIALTLEPFRAYSTGAESGGGQTSGASSTSTTAGGGEQTTSAGGGQTSSAESGHTHSVSGQTAQSKDLGTKTSNPQTGYYTGYCASWSFLPFYGGTVYFSGISAGGGCVKGTGSEYWGEGNYVTHKHFIGTHTHNVPIGSHDHTVTGTTSSSGSAHTHTVSDHTHSVSDHTHGMQHTHQISAHTHNIVYGIYTSTYPASVYIKLNTTQIAGPFSADEYIDITTEFLNQITTYGWNTLEFTSTQLGKIGATLFMRLFLQAS